MSRSCSETFYAIALLFATFVIATPARAQQAITIHVDATPTNQPLSHTWAYFGYDEPNYTYAPGGHDLISDLSSLSPVPVYIRAHNLLTTGDGSASLKWGSTNAYTEDAAGKPMYDWTITDKIFDTYLRAGAKPFVEIGFMPEALSTHPEPYRHDFPKGGIFTGWTYPPNDYQKWSELVRQWVLHCVARYGAAEVATWYWEVWNEPDIPYWHGTAEEYDKLYDFSADAVKRALPSARVGGPVTTGPANPKAAEYLRQFLEHCAHGTNFATGKTGSPLDFITFHVKGSPKMVNARAEMGPGVQLLSASKGFDIIASFPGFAQLPIILSESDPDGCAACDPKTHPALAYRNGSQYPAYTALIWKRLSQLAAEKNVRLQGILTWAFEFEDQPYFAGFRTLSTNGVAKPELNFFRMAGLMTGDQLRVESAGAKPLPEILDSGVHGAPDIDAVAARADHRITVMLWNYQDDDAPGPDTSVSLAVSGLPTAPARLLIREYRVDAAHSNAYSVWTEIGSPQNPTPEQIKLLKTASDLQALGSPRWVENKNGTLMLPLAVPRESLSLFEFTW
ncbi:MAG: hypothetical protein WA875_12235 [Candidatus Acidiferrales bacterium]